jgi:hypothetical protein
MQQVPKKRGRKSRGPRHSVTVNVPVEIVALIDEARQDKSRIDYIWRVLADHFDRYDLHPDEMARRLREAEAQEDQLRLGEADAAGPTRTEQEPTRAA